MGVTLYKPGTIHYINGIKCEAKVFDPHGFKEYLSKGWFMTPLECCVGDVKKPKEDLPAVEEVEPTSSEEDSVIDGMDDDEVRATAKKAKIKSWHNKSIKRLKSELKEVG